MKVFILVICLIVTGCAYKEVYKPVPTCKEPVLEPEKPLLVDSLKETSTTQDILKALTHDHIYLYNLKNQYRILLQGYKQTK